MCVTFSSGDEDGRRRVENNAVVISQGPGWVFGDVALLFNSPRTASVVAASDLVVWSMDRTTFLQFVMKHAQGARALRFVRKVSCTYETWGAAMGIFPTVRDQN